MKNLIQLNFQTFLESRPKSFALFQDMDEATFCSQPHADFNSVGWHLGHTYCHLNR
ncbi:hypothetical protein F8S20_09960 [Nostoc sp. BAE]|nr:hypothetical protein [Nostoc commune BAE]